MIRRIIVNKKKNQFILIVIPFLIFSVFYFINLAPSSNISSHNIFQQLAPQGFAFYSKNPRDTTFSFESDQDLSIPNFQASNLFGLKREGRAQGIELGKIQGLIPKENWVPCEKKAECEKIKGDLVPTHVEKDRNYRSLQAGTYFVYSYEPLSWYYRDYKETASMKIQMAKVLIK